MRRTTAGLTLRIVLPALLLAAHAVAQTAEYRGHTGNHAINLENPVSASNFPEIKVAFATEPFAVTGASENAIVCLISARLKGVKVFPTSANLSGQLVNLDAAGGNVGAPLGNLPAKSPPRPFAPDARFAWTLPDFSNQFGNGDDPVVGVLLEGSMTGNQMVDQMTTQCRAQNLIRCTKTNQRACVLAGNRFKIEVLSSNGASRNVTSNPANGNSAVFNIGGGTLDVKVTNQCSNNNHFWVTHTPTSGDEYILIIEDTQTGESYSTVEPTTPRAVTDIAAFATCP